MLKGYFEKLIANSFKQNASNILDFIEPNSEHVLIDLGCDDGSWTSKLAQKAGTTKIYGVELVKERADIAAEYGVMCSSYDLNNQLNFENDSFDIVHANQVIEHLHDTDTFLSEIYRILKPGGYVVISTENLASTHNIFALLLGFQPFSMTNFSSKGAFGNPFALHIGHPPAQTSWQHTRLFSLFGLKDLLCKHGFTVEGVKTAGYYPLFGFLSKVDPIHGHWLTIKARKPVN